MLRRKSLAMAVALAAMTCGAVVRASDSDLTANSTDLSSYSTSALSSDPLLMDDTTPPDKPLMAALDKIGVGDLLKKANISIGGYVEGSWEYVRATPPGTNFISGRAFDAETESILLNQLDLDIQRPVDTTKNVFDIGFNVEQIYGADGAYIHANGLTTYSPTKILGAYTSSGIRQPKNQYDLNQAYLSFAIPVGNGIGIQVGKWDTLLGYEVIDAPSNPLYTHSFLFTQLPFTQTGALISYNVTSTFFAEAGFSRGWDQALKDTNGDLDLTGQFKYTPNSKLTLYLNWSTGDQTPDPAPGTPGLDTWRTVFDFIGTYAVSDNLSVTANGDYGFQPKLDNGGTGQWYGIALYGTYSIPSFSYVAFNLRGEWFDDQDGVSPGSFNPGVPTQYYELTFGLKITPFPNNNILSNLVFRPEARWDYATKQVWAGGRDRNQFTAAIEGYFQF